MKKAIGAILIIASLVLGYAGYNKVSESSKSVKILGTKFEASDDSDKQQGYIFLGLAVVVFVGGVYIFRKSR